MVGNTQFAFHFIFLIYVRMNRSNSQVFEFHKDKKLYKNQLVTIDIGACRNGMPPFGPGALQPEKTVGEGGRCRIDACRSNRVRCTR
jgi:hypothetical protein